MQELDKITTPFGLLDTGTQEALRAHGGPWQMWDGRPMGWQSVTRQTWGECSTYRVKPSPPKPREFWITDCGFRTWTSPEQAKKYGEGETIHVREVLP